MSEKLCYYTIHEEPGTHLAQEQEDLCSRCILHQQNPFERGAKKVPIHDTAVTVLVAQEVIDEAAARIPGRISCIF